MNQPAPKIAAVFAKTGDMKFISHLDLMRLFHRAIRRAGLPVAVSQGFSPHLKVSVPKALKLGAESVNEEAVFHLDRVMAPQEFLQRLNEQLPPGVRILKAGETP